MQLRSLLAVILLAASASSTRAQSFNVDIGTFNAVPSSAYGAAALQPGTWNQIDPTFLGTPQALLDVNGAATPATLTLNNGGPYDYYTDNLLTTGDDDLLMDDCQDAAFTGGSTMWTFSNLAAGTYTLTTYAWAPDDDTFIDSVACGVVDPPQNCGGPWPGAHALGVTYTVHHDTVAAGGSISVTISTVVMFSTVNGFQLTGNNDTPSAPFCDGSGVGTACLACGNNGAAGNGCANSGFPAGGHLASFGVAGASAGTDTLKLKATNVTGPGLFFQASGLATSPIPFGDGELCATTGILRLGVVFPGPPSPANTEEYPGGLTPNPIHIGGGTASGDVRHYQCWYRDAIPFCTGFTYNLTNGVTLTWGP